MKRKSALIALTVLVLAAGVAIIVRALIPNETGKQEQRVSAQTIKVEAPRIGLSVQRDETLVEGVVGENDSKSGKLWAFRQPSGSSRPFVVSASYEQGASITKLTSVTKKPVKEAVLDNVNRQLRQYPEYKSIDQKDSDINSVEATQIVFEYVSQGVRVRQRLLLLFKSSDTVVYIRGQAKATEFDAIDRQYFEPLFSSATFE